jgi:class 3 adenylate cyclase/tetratricopeptide (TPR) repeat protein
MAACTQCGAPLPEAARFCPSCAAPVAHGPAAAEERKLATVLFADLVGSTALGGSQDPERTRAMLDRFYDAMAAEIERVGGTVEKFVGDAVMAAFGAPAALEDHAERALHAALAMQHRLHELFDDRLALRIGVNTGDVVVGRPREGSSFVTGDAVNVGARLEQAAEPGEILAGERTVAAVRGAFEFEEPVTIGAKGKPDGVVSRRLVRALTLMRPRGVGGLGQAFVGRETELDRLRTAYTQVVEGGEPRLVTVLGDAGVGKSRLVRELWAWLAEQEPQPLQRTGRCLSYGHGTAYWPLAEIMKEHFGILDSDPPGSTLERLGEHHHLGLTLGLDVAPGLHPLAARERLHDSWVEFLSELVTDRPAVLLVEDVHWADDDLLDLLDSLVTQVRGPLLLIATARPELLERRPAWNRFALALEALPPTAAHQLLDELVGVDLCGPVRDVVIERAEGNPFFVEELIATLIDRGVIARQNGGWACFNLPEGFEVPDTVQAVLAARIDLLPAAEKAALQAASVIGRVFWTGPVYELAGGSPDFGLLEERDFVRRRAGSSIAGEREYAIKHALTREVAYDSVPKAKRARLHASFATWLERGAEADDEHASLLAYHYARAVRPEDVDLAWPGEDEQVERLREHAVRWSRRAAELAIGRYEIDEGLAMLRRAVELEPDPAKQAELWYEIGHASALKYDGEGFVAAMEKAIELGGPSATVYTELGFQTVQRAGMWKRRPDRDVVTGWIEEAMRLTDEASPLRAKAVVSKALWHDDADDAAEAYRLADQMGDEELRSYALEARVSAACFVGDFERACELLEERLALVPGISDPDHCCEAYSMASMVYLGAGRTHEARRSVAQHDEMAAGLTPHHRLHSISHRVAIDAAIGEWDAVKKIVRAVEHAVEANIATPCPMNLNSLLVCAVASAQLDDDEEARRLEAKADALGMEGYTSAVNPPKLRLALARSDLAELRQLVDSMTEEELQPWAYTSLSGCFDALAVLGDRDRLEEHAPRWLGSRSYLEPFAERALGQLRGDRSLVEQAAAHFEAMGAAFYVRETRALL